MRDRDYRGKYKTGRATDPVYKKDSTKGKSLLIDPQTFKGDALVQVWVDSRILATLSNWLDAYNHTRFMSEVVKDTLRATVELLVEQGEVEFVNDTLEARKLLEMKYRVNLNPRGKGMKNVMHNKLLSDKNKFMRSKLNVRQGMSVAGNYSGHDVSSEDVEMVNRMVEFNRQKKAAGSGLREDMSREELKAYEEEREKKVREEENAPIDIEEMKRLGQIR